jgi:ABC-type sugar transport system, periplasmic component
MAEDSIKILAVNDPAIKGYSKPEYKILKHYNQKVNFDILPWESYYPTMMEAFAGKADYDIVMVAGHLWLRELVEKNYLAPIPEIKEDILDGLKKDLIYEGKTYLSPSFFDGHIIIYRKSLLGEQWEDVISPLDYIKKIKGLKKNNYIAMKAAPAEIFTDALPYLRAYGKDVYADKSYEIQCAKAEIVTGLEAYYNLKCYAVEHTNTFGNKEVAGCIKDNQVAAAVTWSGQMGIIYQDDCFDKSDLAFSTFSTAWNTVWSFAINNKSKQQEKCINLLQYLRSYEVDQLVSQISGTPLHKKLYENQMYPWYKCQLKMVNLAKPLPFIANASVKNQVLYKEITKVFNKEKTPFQGMYDAQRMIRSM